MFSGLEGVGGIEINIFWSLTLLRLLECCEGYFIASGQQAQAGDWVGMGILISSVIETKSGAMAITSASCPICSREGRIPPLLRGKD